MPMQVSWIDADEVGALLGRLRDTPTAEPADESHPDVVGLLPASPEPGPLQVIEASCEAPAPVVEPAADSHSDLDLFRARLQAIRERAMNAGLLPGEAASPTPAMAEVANPPPDEDESDVEPWQEAPCPAPVAEQTISRSYQPSGSSVDERLDSFAAWAGPLVQGSRLFVIDDQGDLLWGRSSHQELVVTTVMAWVAFSRMSGVLAFERVPLLHQRMATGDHLTALPCPTRLGLLHIAITGDDPVADEHVPELRQALIAAMEAS